MHRSTRFVATLAVLLVLCCAPWVSTDARERPPRDPEPEDVCFLDSGLDPQVALSWREVRSDDDKASLKQPVLHLLAENRTRRTLQARLTLHPLGQRRAGRTDLGVELLPAGTAALIPVDLREVGFDLGRLRTSGSLRAFVQVFEEGRYAPFDAAERLDESFAPTVYFHGDVDELTGEPVTRVYGENVMRLAYDHGQPHNPLCTLTLTTGDDDGRGGGGKRDEPAIEMVIDPGMGAPQPDDDFVNPGNVGAPPGTRTFCFRIPVDTEDSGVGEDFWNQAGVQYFPASYAQVRIKRLPPGAALIVDDEYLDEDGCITFQDVSPSGWFVQLFSNASIPRTDEPDQRNQLRVRTASETVAGWSWCTDPAASDLDEQTLTLNANRRSNLLALATFSMMRFSDGVGNDILTIRDLACKDDPPNSCAGKIHPNHNRFKHAIAHEVGHDIVKGFLGSYPKPPGCQLNDMYNVNFGGDECVWDGSHALHSMEYSAGAVTEGFSQFFATAVWNRIDQQDGWFHYYKEDYKNGTVKEVDMESGSAGGQLAYLYNVCEPEGSNMDKQGLGTELDWARQLWDYLTNPGTIEDPPTRLELLEQMQLAYFSNAIEPAWDMGNFRSRIRSALGLIDADNCQNPGQCTDYLGRWDATELANGTYFDENCDCSGCP